MYAQPYILSEEAFHSDVTSCSGVVGEVWDGNMTYSFEGMFPKPLPSKTPSASKKLMVEETLNLVLKKLKTMRMSVCNTLEDIDASVSPFPSFF